MYLYGGLPAPVAAGILLLFSLIMGLYYGLFGWLIAFSRHATGGVRAPLFLAPFLWTAIDLLGAHLIKVPWDQLGYSQIDNAALTSIAPWTGTYGITFVLLAVNVLFAAGIALAEEALVDGRCCGDGADRRRDCCGIRRLHRRRRRPCCCRRT